MISRYSPPETYQQWLECFQHLQQHPRDHEMLGVVSQGQYLGKPAEAFLVRLSETVGLVITDHCQRFLRQIDLAFEAGEPDMVLLLAQRLRKNLQKCFFYRSLPFLDDSYVQTLDDGFNRQLVLFWSSFVDQLRKSARESMDPGMEELYHGVKRMKIVQQEVRK